MTARLTLLLLLAFLPGRVALTQGVGSQVMGNPSVSASSVELSQEKPLLQKVSVTAPGIPLDEILEMVSAQYHVSLRATRPASDQRFTVATQDLPLHILMQQIVRTLGHTSEKGMNSPAEYEWRKLRDKGKDQYVLICLVPASLQQRRALAAERERMRILLREMRDLLNLPEMEAKKSENASHFPSDLLERSYTFNAIFFQAVRALGDRDIDALVRGDDVPVLPSLLKDVVSAYDREKQDDYTKALEQWKPGFGRPTLPVPTVIAAAPYLRLRSCRANETQPGERAAFVLMLEGVLDEEGFYIDPNYRLKPPLTSPQEKEPLLDLVASASPTEKKPEMPGKSRHRDLPTTLIALARAAKINLVQEHFYKIYRVGSPLRNVYLPSNGTRTAFLNEICRIWGYTAVKDGEVYRLWSPTWVSDRECDVPERKITPWRKIWIKQGKFTIDNQIRLSAEFTWEQVAVTLTQTLLADMKGDIPGWDEQLPAHLLFPQLWWHHTLRLQGIMSSAERQAALSPDGIPVADLRPEVRAEIFRSQFFNLYRVPSQKRLDSERARLATARLYLKPPSAGWRIPVPLSEKVVAAPQ